MSKPALLLLTWRDLEATCESIETWGSAGLLDGAEKIAYVNELDQRKKAVLKGEFGFHVLGTPENKGIAAALSALFEEAQSPYSIFLEHDWHAVGSPSEVRRQVQASEHLLDQGFADAVRLRHRVHYGEPLYSRHLGASVFTDQPRHSMDCVHWCDDPVAAAGDDRFWSSSYDNGDLQLEPVPVLSTSCQYAAYTNNPTMYRTKFLKQKLGPFCSQLGFSDVEKSIGFWWNAQALVVARPDPGIFMHVDGDL